MTQRQYPNGDDGSYSKSKEQHWEHLLALFPILATNGSALNLDVYIIHILDFLAQHISTTDVAPLWDNI